MKIGPAATLSARSSDAKGEAAMSATRAAFGERAFARGETADIDQILDEGPWTTMQKIVVVMTACSIIVDGFDG